MKKITESKLKQIVSESVKKVLNEGYYDQGDRYVKTRTYGPKEELITPSFFIGQKKEILYNFLLNLKNDIGEAEEQTQYPNYNHKFDGVYEKLETVYELVKKAYNICDEISKMK